MKTSITENKKIYFLSIIVLLIIWKTASFAYNNEALLPSPESVIISMINLLQSADFIKVLCFTLLRGFAGFILSLIIGSILGTWAGINLYVEKFLTPLLSVIKSTPFMSVILLSLLWLGSEKTPIFAGFLVSFPIIYTNMLQGTRSIDKSLIEMARVYGIDRLHILKDIFFPSTAPFLFAGIASAFSIGWKVTVGAEVLSQPKYAIGTSLWESKIFIEVEILLAWTIYTILISSLIEIFIKIIEKKAIRWKHEI